MPCHTQLAKPAPRRACQAELVANDVAAIDRHVLLGLLVVAFEDTILDLDNFQPLVRTIGTGSAAAKSLIGTRRSQCESNASPSNSRQLKCDVATSFSCSSACQGWLMASPPWCLLRDDESALGKPSFDGRGYSSTTVDGDVGRTDCDRQFGLSSFELHLEGCGDQTPLDANVLLFRLSPIKQVVTFANGYHAVTIIGVAKPKLDHSNIAMPSMPPGASASNSNSRSGSSVYLIPVGNRFSFPNMCLPSSRQYKAFSLLFWR